MRLRYKLLQWIAGLVAVVGTSPAAAQDPDELAAVAATIPVEAFFQESNTLLPKLSPDGQKVAYLRREGEGLGLWVLDRTTGTVSEVTSRLSKRSKDLFWKGNDHLVFIYTAGTQDRQVGLLIRIDGSESKALTAFHLGDELVAVLHDDPERVIVRDETLRYSNLFSGASKKIYNLEEAPLVYWYREPVVDGDGVMRLVNRIKPTEGLTEVLYREGNDDDWNVLVEGPINAIRPNIAISWISKNGDAAYVVSQHEHDRGALYELDLKSRSLGREVFTPPEGEITGIFQNIGNDRFLGIQYRGDKEEIEWLDEAFQGMHQKLRATFPDRIIRFLDTSTEEKVFLVAAFSDTEAGNILVFDRALGELKSFRRTRPKLDPALMRPQRIIRYPSADGLEIPAYLTLPHVQDTGRRVPLVVLTHRDSFVGRWHWGFDSTVQFLASRGYAVLQVNHRGSAGFGREFLEQGRFELGGAILQDLEDGVAWAVKQGFVDPDRVAIWGGYLALAGVTLRPEEYACGINIGGRADMEIAYRRPGAHAYMASGSVDFRDQWIGTKKSDRDAISPIKQVGQLRVPTFHVYRKDEPGIRPEHAKRLQRALKKHGVPHEFFIESSAFTPESVFERYRMIERFLAKHL